VSSVLLDFGEKVVYSTYELEQQRFSWPKPSVDSAMQVSGKELNWLLDGLDIWRFPAHKTLKFDSVI